MGKWFFIVFCQFGDLDQCKSQSCFCKGSLIMPDINTLVRPKYGGGHGPKNCLLGGTPPHLTEITLAQKRDCNDMLNNAVLKGQLNEETFHMRHHTDLGT